MYRLYYYWYRRLRPELYKTVADRLAYNIRVLKPSLYPSKRPLSLHMGIPSVGTLRFHIFNTCEKRKISVYMLL